MSELLEIFWGPHVIDGWTCVLEKDESNWPYYPMIATDDTGTGFYQHTEGMYDPYGLNTHLGTHPRLIDEGLMNRILGNAPNQLTNKGCLWNEKNKRQQWK
jgi:hypothetical protein